MKKSKERIAIEKAIGECQDEIDSCCRRLVELTTEMDRVNEEKRLHWAHKAFLLSLIGLPADPVAAVTNDKPTETFALPAEKARRKRKPKVTTPPAEDAPTHHCTSCNADVTPAPLNGTRVCPLCSGSMIAPLPNAA